MYRIIAVALLFLFAVSGSVLLFADEKSGYPERPSPPRLVNDYAHVMSEGQAQELENRLVGFSRTTSCQVSIVTVQSLDGHDINEYSVHIFNDWGLGEKGKENGVLILVALDDGYGKKRAFITVGRGLQGVLTDAKCGNIVRNEMIPHFKNKDYFGGLSAAADAVIAVTKDEYKNDNPVSGRKKHVPLTAIIIIVIIIVLILKMRNRGGGGGGGSYMSGGGMGDLATGFLLGNLLGGGRGVGFGGGGGGFGGGDSGGFGGFGGGSTDGGGAGGSW